MPPYFKTSPVDCFGYRYKCCYCIPLRLASFIAAILSCLWATIEMARSDSITKSIFVGVDPLILAIARAVHIFAIVAFLISCGVLLIGVIIQRSAPLRVFVWSGFLFNCMCIMLTALSVIAQLVHTAKLSRKIFTTVLVCSFWYSFHFYLINIVNSYRAVLVGEGFLYAN